MMQKVLEDNLQLRDRAIFLQDVREGILDLNAVILSASQEEMFTPISSLEATVKMGEAKTGSRRVSS